MAAAFDPSNFYTLLYPTKELYDLQKLGEKIGWCFPIALAVAVWDLILNLPKEYRRIWRHQFTLITFLYLGSRYWCVITLSWFCYVYVAQVHEIDFCEKYADWTNSMGVIIEVFACGILLIRTYAFTGRKISYLVFFLILYFGMLGYMFYAATATLYVVPFLQIGQTRGSCMVTSTNSKLTSGSWIATACFSIILTGIAFFHSFQLERKLPAIKRSPVVQVFLKDGLVYLAVMTFINVVNAIMFIQNRIEVKGSAVGFHFLFSSLMSCHMVLSLRDAERMKMDASTSTFASYLFRKEKPSNNVSIVGNEPESIAMEYPSPMPANMQDLEKGGAGDQVQRKAERNAHLEYPVYLPSRYTTSKDDVSDTVPPRVH